MVNKEQAIPCPVCSTNVPFDIYQLLSGVKFTCPNCSASIGLANESKEIVQEAIEQFDEMKNSVLKTNNEGFIS